MRTTTGIMGPASGEQANPAWAILTLFLVIGSGCTDPELPEAQSFEVWSQTAELLNVTAQDLSSCRTANEIWAVGSDELSYVWDARLLPDGRVAVADALHHTILIFFEESPPVRVGRQGEGPGEFGNLRGLVLVADTILAWDQRAQRVTAFSPGGDLLWTERLEADHGADWTGAFTGRTRTGHYPFLGSLTQGVGVEGSLLDTTALLLAHPTVRCFPGRVFHRITAMGGKPGA